MKPEYEGYYDGILHEILAMTLEELEEATEKACCKEHPNTKAKHCQ